MRIRTLMLSVLLLQLLLLAGVGVVLVRLGNAQDTIVRTQEAAVASRALAAELRQSSDDLTRFARTFVVTGDERYLRYFNMVLAIRNGDLARPNGYDGPYWDAVVAGRLPEPTGAAGALSLRSRMEALRFTEEELRLLETAQDRSDALVALEERAFALLEDYRRSGDTAARDSALQLMHGPEYHTSKGSIMAPIGEFEDMVNARAARGLREANSEAARYRTFLLILTSGMFLLLLGATWAIQDRVVRRAGALAVAAEDIQSGKLGVRSGVRGEDELGELGRAFDSMVDELGGALGSARLDSARSKSTLDALVGSNPDGVIEVSADTGLIRSFNPAARKMLGEALASGVPFETLLDLRQAGYGSLEDLAAQEVVEEFDLIGRHGDPVRVEMRAMMVEDGGERVAVLAARDIRKWKRELDARYDEILRLSAPVIELETGVLLVPVVGKLTSQRGSELKRSVLDAIEARTARFCVIDIRGITSMDADVGSHLASVVSAAQLMGCAPVLSGLTPATVEKMYDSDVEWERVVTAGSLKQALAWVRSQMVSA